MTSVALLSVAVFAVDIQSQGPGLLGRITLTMGYVPKVNCDEAQK